jgi:hypothetical protein
MPDNWGYVLAAYTVAAVAFGGYWRHLVRRARETAALAGPRAARPAAPAARRAPDQASAGGTRR